MGWKSPYRNILPSWRMGRDAATGTLSAPTYADKMLGYGPIAYWPLWETAGVTVTDLVNSPAQDGTYTGVTLADTLGPDGVNYAPLFDGANDYANIYSVALNAAFNHSEGSLAMWLKVFNVGVWTDGTFKIAVQLGTLNAAEYARFLLRSEGAFIDMQYKAGGVEDFVRYFTSRVDWFHVVMTWSVSSGPTGELKIYIDGTQSGATQQTLGTWVGALDPGYVNIGSINHGPSAPWYGWLAHCAVWDTPLTAPQIADLAIPTG